MPPAAAEARRFGRALNNLLDNALTHTKEGGRVVLSAADAGGGRVRFTVADAGVGVPPEHLPHIDRIDAATQREVADAQQLARRLGAVPMTFGAGKDFPSAVADFVREYGVTHVVLGRSGRPWYRGWFGPSSLDRLLRLLRGVDVLIVDTR